MLRTRRFGKVALHHAAFQGAFCEEEVLVVASEVTRRRSNLGNLELICNSFPDSDSFDPSQVSADPASSLVVAKKVLPGSVGKAPAKVYIFGSWPGSSSPAVQAAALRHFGWLRYSYGFVSGTAFTQPPLHIGFLYGYKDGGKVVRGLDVITYKTLEGPNCRLYSRTFEKGKPWGDPNQGNLCEKELLILAVEALHRRRHMLGSAQNVEAVVNEFPALPRGFDLAA